MKITFLGATRTVTGSNFLVEAAGKKFLVDCGMWQGKAELEEENSQPFEFNPTEIDFMLLTHAQIPPIYTAEEALHSLEIFEPVQYDEIIEITPEIHVRFNDAGHMLGSSIIELWVKEDGKETKTVFTGDLGNNDIPLLSEPTMIESTDYLIMESTYGSRLHVRNDEKAKIFLDVVSETLDNEGTVVIPSFAVGRTQEILYEIKKI